MTKKQRLSFALFAAFIGIILGGISKLFDVDLCIYAIVIPIVIFGGLAGGAHAISKKSKK